MTYTPLTIDDMDVTDLLVFDVQENFTILDVSDTDWEPDYPIVVISLNESMALQNLPGSLMKGATPSTLGIFCEKITVRRPRSLEPWYKGHADMVVAEIDEDGTGYIYKVNNPGMTQSCHTKKSKTASRYIDDGSSADIKVYEFDLGGWPEWIIEDAYLYDVTSGGGWSMIINDEGRFYDCGHHTRCSYEFKLKSY